MIELLTDPQAWIAFATLTALEIVLGVDNVIFISILAGKLPPEQRNRARRVGLAAALISRLLLLMTLAWIAKLTTPLFTLMGHGFSGRDLVLAFGGLFLIYKATHEIHEKLEGGDHNRLSRATATFATVIAQIMVIDIVFSLDSIITAVGMAEHLAVMVAAVIAAVAVMMIFANAIGEFVERHPTVKMLALGFLLLIGTALIADGCGVHVPKGYIYSAMAFSVFVELLNLRAKKKAQAPHVAPAAACPACGRPMAG
ncbi:MAG TPA: TerC family protein [Candidatus Polarisedimenticolaceae bacterium]|nr:TerC family protein [Candidatus Polarisedimenticolaceae bacterium]